MSEQENSSSNPPSAESQNSQKSIDAEPPGVKATFSPCILQCPKQGRMSGFAENSIKRMLDPPLVVEACPQVELSEPDKELLASTMLCQVTLYHESKDIPLAYLMNPDSSLGDQRFPYSINLLGEKIQTCFYMPIDHQDEKKHYIFVFTGLSIRCPGRYRFLCSILDTTTFQCNSVISEVFELYSPANFPGILEPTRLSKYLYLHGLKVRSGYHSKKGKEEKLHHLLANFADDS